MPGKVFWLVGKPGGRPDIEHRLRKLMVEKMRWRRLVVVLEDVRKEPGT